MSTQLHYKLILQIQIPTKGVNLRIAKKNMQICEKSIFGKKSSNKLLPFQKRLAIGKFAILILQ